MLALLLILDILRWLLYCIEYLWIPRAKEIGKDRNYPRIMLCFVCNPGCQLECLRGQPYGAVLTLPSDDIDGHVETCNFSL